MTQISQVPTPVQTTRETQEFNHDVTRGLGQTFGSFAAYGGIALGGVGFVAGYITGGTPVALITGAVAGGTTAFAVSLVGKASQYVLDKGLDGVDYALKGVWNVITFPFKGAPAVQEAIASAQSSPQAEV